MFNRQPTLHKQSMMAYRVRLLPGKTFRMNLSACRPHNADFDGDEMNVHVPQSRAADVELEELSHISKNMISAQSNRNVIGIVQDALIGSYLLTRPGVVVARNTVFDCVMAANVSIEQYQDTLERAERLLGHSVRSPWAVSGKILISTLFPRDFTLTRRTGSDTTEPEVVIREGILLSGVLCSQLLGARANSIIQILNKEYGWRVASDFISNLQFLVNLWLSRFGFSVGIEDCLLRDRTEIEATIAQMGLETTAIETTEPDAEIREERIITVLNSLTNIGHRLYAKQIDRSNRLLQMVVSGSKGNLNNIVQIAGLVGQQNISARRVALNAYGRTLSCFRFGDKSIEARGFVCSNYMRGLDPAEFFFHMGGSRMGLMETSIKTSVSGYEERRLTKLLEDLDVCSDGTVRTSTGSVVQFSYGNDGLDGSKLVRVAGATSFCDIGRLVDTLNVEE
jgi:DNA-directed RNA polymerase II subunit RPB1